MRCKRRGECYGWIRNPNVTCDERMEFQCRLVGGIHPSVLQRDVCKLLRIDGLRMPAAIEQHIPMETFAEKPCGIGALALCTHEDFPPQLVRRSNRKMRERDICPRFSFCGNFIHENMVRPGGDHDVRTLAERSWQKNFVILRMFDRFPMTYPA